MADMALMCWDELRLGEMMIQMELQFDGELDSERLARALDLVLDAQPVLGCRAEIHPDRMVWRRLPAEERKNLAGADSESDYENFKISPIDSTAGPQVKACLLRTGGRDRLLLKVAHQVADAGGVKEVAEDVAAIYSRLESEPGYIPEPNLDGCRDWMQVYRRVPRYAYPKIFLNFLRENRAVMIPFATRALQLPEAASPPVAYITRLLSADRVAALSEYGRARGATLNDMVAAAYIRANAASGGPEDRGRHRLHMTIDLRQWHLGSARAEGICNLSAFEYISLGKNPGLDFDDTLGRVSSFMRARKANWPGLNQVFHLPLYYRLSYEGLLKFFKSYMAFMTKKHNFPNTLTNMGQILPEHVTFDKLAPSSARLLVPPIYPPAFGAGLSGYNGTITLSAGAPEAAKAAIEAFFDKILSELPE